MHQSPKLDSGVRVLVGLPYWSMKLIQALKNLFKNEPIVDHFLDETDTGWAINKYVDGTFNEVVATYSRKRDAIRGAQRRGILLENV